jgi:cytochrome P450/NAD(P)-dependent dehydrogenase (short-subunit alcohol dehydrogenase family)
MRSVDEGLRRLRAETGATAADPRLIGVTLDLADPGSIGAAAKAIEDAVGAPDVLVHNAGIAAAGSFEDTPATAWRDIFTTNVFGPIELTRALLPGMRAAGRGRIVVVSSQGAVRGMPAISAYAASKGALERWAEALAGEIAPFGLGISVVVAGTFKTDILVKTSDYRNYKGAYAAHYVGIDKTGDVVLRHAQPPERFARALAKAISEREPFARHTAGIDATMLVLLNRVLPGWGLHHVIRLAMRLPRAGALRPADGARSATVAVDPPIAPGLPIVGAAPAMLRDAVGFVLRTAHELGPLFRIPMGPRTLTLIAHPDDLRRVLQEDPKDYPRGKVVDPMRLMLGNGLPMSDAEVWRRKRRTMQPAFNKARIARLTDTMSTVTQRYVDAFREGQRLDAHDLMMRLARDIIVETMFSDQLGADTADLDAAFAELERYVARYSFVPFTVPLWLPTPDNAAFRRARATLDRLIVSLIAARRASGAQHGDLLDALLEARDEDGQPMPPQELRDEAVSIFFAGHETSANVLTWTTYLVSSHPEVLERLREEADRVIGDRLPTIDDVPKLEYATAVLRESMRLYPPAWIYGRVADRDDVLRGFRIRKGDMLGICPLVAQRLPESWPDPERFDPERFRGDKGTNNRDFTYIPFGAGPHTCIGNHFALTETAIVLAMIVRRATLVVERPESVRMQSTLTLQVAGGLPVRVEMRARACHPN